MKLDSRHAELRYDMKCIIRNWNSSGPEEGGGNKNLDSSIQTQFH